ncbi:hypothetical protein H4582DRAFT_2135884 [Lactarius indigo]|nr:hypothetical protein H4582DRAFT_2135884 [Lactarius indigo]
MNPARQIWRIWAVLPPLFKGQDWGMVIKSTDEPGSREPVALWVRSEKTSQGEMDGRSRQFENPNSEFGIVERIGILLENESFYEETATYLETTVYAEGAATILQQGPWQKLAMLRSYRHGPQSTGRITFKEGKSPRPACPQPAARGKGRDPCAVCSIMIPNGRPKPQEVGRTPTHFFPLLIMGPLATHDFVPSIELETSQTTPYDGLRALTIAPRKARDFLEPDSVLINVTRAVTLSSNGWEFTTRALSADLYEHFPDGRSRGAKSFELPGSQGVYPLPSRVRATTMAPYDREKIRTNPGLGGTALEISEEWMGRPLQ